MKFIYKSMSNSIVTVTLSRGKVNAINEEVIDELHETFLTIEKDDSINAVILTGTGSFFSFGFDIPHFYDYPPEKFRVFIEKFTAFYTYLFLYPKPVIAAINGHAVAGGCMLCNSCDYRVIAEGKAKVALNELAFGATVFAGSVAILKAVTGYKNAERILFTGYMFDNEQSLKHKLVNEVIASEELLFRAHRKAEKYGNKYDPAFASIKRLLREPIVESYREREKLSIDEFLEIWYSDVLRENLKTIQIGL
ncbi:MAG: enoyl-CoA hydratase/isomerase family protein [candidate division Zixibacteria bacterium]|nr:enoyl-CoA hydratase/isomerase family protein [candidate division Zixibacteria bacterium]